MAQKLMTPGVYIEEVNAFPARLSRWQQQFRLL